MRVLKNNFISLDSLKYMLANYISVLFSILLNFAMMKFLDPVLLGKTTLGKSIFQSFDIAHFGIRYGLDRILPHSISSKEKSEIFTVGYFSSFFFSFFFFLFWLVYELDDFLFYSCFYISGMLYSLITISRIYYRAQEDKKSFINFSVLTAVIPSVAQLLSLYYWGIYGYLFAHLTSYFLLYILSITFFRIKFSYKRNNFFKLFKKLFGSGYLLFISAMVSYISMTGDRFIIAHYWGLETVGVFGIVMFFFSIFNIYSVSYTELIMNELIIKSSFKYVLKQMFFLISSTFLFVLIAYYFVPYFVQLFIPQYLEYVKQMRLILLGIIPYSILPVLNYHLHSRDKRDALLVINLICTMIYFILLYVVLNYSNSFDYLVILKNLFFYSITIMTLSYCAYIEYKVKR